MTSVKRTARERISFLVPIPPPSRTPKIRDDHHHSHEDDDNMDIQPIVTALTTMNEKQREDHTTENIRVDLPETMNVSRLLSNNLFEQGYYYYQVRLGMNFTIFWARGERSSSIVVKV